MAETFTCANCDKTFEKAWSDEDAAKESRELWGVSKQDDPTMAEVCDDCHKAFMTWYREQVAGR